MAIRQEAPYTAFDRIPSRRPCEQVRQVRSQAVLGQVATELNPECEELQEDLHTRAQEYEVKLEQKDAKIAETKSIADWAVLAAV